MRRSKIKTYYLIKENKHDHQEWLRYNRRVRRKLHLDYSTRCLMRAIGNIPRPYEGNYKQWDNFRQAMREAVRDFPEFFRPAELEVESVK